MSQRGYFTSASLPTRVTKFHPSARAGGDCATSTISLIIFTFQPAPPMRAETYTKLYLHDVLKIFQPAPPVRAETYALSTSFFISMISTRSARAGGDPSRNRTHSRTFQFQPAPPMRAETSNMHRATLAYMSTIDKILRLTQRYTDTASKNYRN